MTTLAEKVAEFDATIPDWQVAEFLNSPNGEANGYVWIPLSCLLIRDALLASGEWLILKHAKNDTGLEQSVRDAAETFIDTVTMQDRINITDDTYRQVVMTTVSLLVTAGLLSQSTVDAVINVYGRRPLSWAESNGIRVDAREVGIARGGKA